MSVAQRKALVNWFNARIRKYYYTNDWGKKFYPDTSGGTDCSGVIYAAYQSIGYTIGRMSYEQAKNGREIASYHGPQSGSLNAFNAIIGKLQSGDIVAMGLTYGLGRGNSINHVEMYVDSGNSFGHGGPGNGPTLHNIGVNYLLPKCAQWTVRRILSDSNNNTGGGESTPPTTDEEIVEDIKMNVKATHVIFNFEGGICIANILNGTWQRMPNMEVFELRKTVLSRTADLHYWSEFTTGGKSNAADGRAFGTEVK